MPKEDANKRPPPTPEETLDLMLDDAVHVVDSWPLRDIRNPPLRAKSLPIDPTTVTLVVPVPGTFVIVTLLGAGLSKLQLMLVLPACNDVVNVRSRYRIDPLETFKTNPLSEAQVCERDALPPIRDSTLRDPSDIPLPTNVTLVAPVGATFPATTLLA